MRIRFFNAYDTAAPFFRNLIPYLINDSGHQVEVVLSKAKYRSGGAFERAISNLKGIRVVKAASLGLNPSSIIMKSLVLFAYLIHASVYSLVSHKVDCNVFLTQPPLFSLWGYVLSKIRRQPYCCVVMDIYPDLAVEFGILPRHSLWTSLLRSLSSFSLRKADSVVVIGRCMADKVRSKGVGKKKIHFIPNWADEQDIHPVRHSNNQFRKNQWWSDKFIVLYAGNIGIPQHFDDILAVAKGLQNDGNEEIVFVFIGGGSRFQELEYKSAALDNVVLMPFQHEAYPLAEILSAGDLHVVPLKDVVTGLAVPSKTYSSLAAGRPVIYQGSEKGEIARMIIEEGVGEVIRCGDAEGLKRSILSYADQPARCKMQGAKARTLAEGPYSRERCLALYAAVFSNRDSIQQSAKGPGFRRK